MRLISLALASVGTLFAMNAHATLIEHYDYFNITAFADSPIGVPNGGYVFQGDTNRTSSPSTFLNLPRFDSTLGTLQSVQLELRSTIFPVDNYIYDSAANGYVRDGYFPGQAHDPFGTLYSGVFPVPYFYYDNDAELSYKVSAILSLDALFPNISTAAKGLSASSSCSDSEISVLGLSVSCRTHDADGFGVSGFDWDFTVANVADFVGSGNLGFKVLADAAFEGYCDFDDEDNDYVSQTTCTVDPWFYWEGLIRVGYNYTTRVPGGEDGGGIPVPEPASAALLGSGIAGLLAARWRRRVRG